MARTDILNTVRSERSGLIRATQLEGAQRARLERAVLDSLRAGASIDEVSDASGLTPQNIRDLLARPTEMDAEIPELAGVL